MERQAASAPGAMSQEQFLNVLDRDEAERRFLAAVNTRPRGVESVPLADALGRVLAEAICSLVDVPSCDRANVDGYALRSADSFGAFEQQPRYLRLNAESITPGKTPAIEVRQGTATAIATGAMLPRGADCVVMIEHTEVEGDTLILWRPAAPGAMVTFAGTDIARGETVLRAGILLTSREIGVLAAVGVAEVAVIARPRVAIFSTGDEIVRPGAPLPAGSFYDSNSAILAAAVRELGGEPRTLGVAPDDEIAIRSMLLSALADSEIVILSGGTSKGQGDLNAAVLAALPGARILAHGVALKPGKPICLAAVNEQAVVILPGFPTSAIFTFHEFVAPLIRMQCGLPAGEDPEVIEVRMPMRVNSEIGRTEYLLVGLVASDDGASAYPMGKGSGSVTTFSAADAFIKIPRQVEYLEEGARVPARLLGRGLRPAELVVIGSHCVGLDFLLGLLQARGVRSRFMAVGSNGGLLAARRGECDLAGIHLLDAKSGIYNEPFLGRDLELIRGYGRMQGLVFQKGNPRFADAREARSTIAQILQDPDAILANRNRGSGTRILIDELLAGQQPRGFAMESRSHNAVAAAIAAGRADWGIAIQTVAMMHNLSFLPLVVERFDLAVPIARRERDAVKLFAEVLASNDARERLLALGFVLDAPDRGSP